MRTKHLFGLIHIGNKGGVLRRQTCLSPSFFFKFTDRSKAVIFSGSFFLIFCFMSVMLFCLFLAALCSPAGKALTSWLSFPYCVLGQVWYLMKSISDLCLLTYFVQDTDTRHIQKTIHMQYCVSLFAYVKTPEIRRGPVSLYCPPELLASWFLRRF